jgi:hypothetical protein
VKNSTIQETRLKLLNLSASSSFGITSNDTFMVSLSPSHSIPRQQRKVAEQRMVVEQSSNVGTYNAPPSNMRDTHTTGESFTKLLPDMVIDLVDEVVTLDCTSRHNESWDGDGGGEPVSFFSSLYTESFSKNEDHSRTTVYDNDPSFNDTQILENSEVHQSMERSNNKNKSTNKMKMKVTTLAQHLGVQLQIERQVSLILYTI